MAKDITGKEVLCKPDSETAKREMDKAREQVKAELLTGKDFIFISVDDDSTCLVGGCQMSKVPQLITAMLHWMSKVGEKAKKAKDMND